MTYLDQEAMAVLHAARLIVVNATWHLREEQALGRLAGARGPTCTPLFPGHPVIQIVAYDGRLPGRARSDTGFGACWFAGSLALGVLYDRSVTEVVVFSVALRAAALPLLLVVRRTR
ncbi:hypothetical protein [Streptomyces sp. NPDC091383]|uniref:hypothetical protein n=1 Tax=Streptomyces sp. NPDC091383 TaxID=3365996 RepID=UPI00381401FA